MNLIERLYLRVNWERYKEGPERRVDFGQNCYFYFGPVDFSINKRKAGTWQHKTVCGWKAISYNDFLARFSVLDWKK